MFSSGSDISGTIAKAVAAAARASCLKSMVVEVGVVAMQKKIAMKQSTVMQLYGGWRLEIGRVVVVGSRLKMQKVKESWS